MYQSVPARTGPGIKSEFERLGVSIADWARAKGFSPPLVYQILAGRKRCSRGQSHQIAVALGLKQGRIGSVADIGAMLASEQVSDAPQVQPKAEQESEGAKA